MGINSLRPRVSVCIPAYNHPDKLRRALQSIAEQTFTDYEVVIADDSPNDGVEKVAAAFRPKINLRYKKNQTTMGSPENWNEAVRISSGDYIKLLHHDDWFCDKDSLSTFVAMLDSDSHADFAFSSSIACDPAQNILFVHTPPKSVLRRLRSAPKCLFLGNFIGCPSATIYRRNVKHTYDPKLKWRVDVDFYIRILNDNNHFVFTPQPLVSLEISEHSVTASCLGNASVELFEGLYLYRKISAADKLDFRYYWALWRLFIKFSVTRRQELLDLGADLEGLPALNRILFLQHILLKTGLLKSLLLIKSRAAGKYPNGSIHR